MSTRHSTARRSTERSTGIGRIVNLVVWLSGDLVIERRIERRSARRLERGFTLIELLIVLTLITILSTIGMAQYQRSVVYAREATLKEDLFRMRDAIDQYYADKNQYPSTLDALVSEGYMRKVPEDPFTKSNSTWQTVPAEPDPNNPAAEAGIYDVKSGSDQTALDGTAYSEWD
jgi:general secretion pathway protein G